MIKTITVTGADDSVIDINKMVEISKQYPKVEWGILVSRSNGGGARFPSLPWMEKLAKVHENNPGVLNLSSHICGGWVREIFREGKADIFDFLPMSMFKRVQFNFHGHQHALNIEAALNVLKEKFSAYELIFQFDGVNDGIIEVCNNSGLKAYPLFDLSGGAGILPTEWPIAKGYSGYAGGLSPENVTQELSRIRKACNGNTIWIDAETHLRSHMDQLFDMDKVLSFIKNIYSWTI